MKKSRLLLGLYSIVISIIFTTTAHATTITLNLNIDLDANDIRSGGGYYTPKISVNLPELSVGDIIDATWTFNDNKRLALTSTRDHEIVMVAYGNSSSFVPLTVTATTSTYEFLGLEGEFLSSNPATSNTNFECSTACYASLMNKNLTNSYFSFTGVRIISEITELYDPVSPEPGQLFTTDEALLVFDYADASIVPIPAAIWLFGSGLLGLIGIAGRRAA